MRVWGSDCCAWREALLLDPADKAFLSTVAMAPAATATDAAAATVQQLLVGLEPEVFLQRNAVTVGHASVLRCQSLRQRRRR